MNTLCLDEVESEIGDEVEETSSNLEKENQQGGADAEGADLEGEFASQDSEERSTSPGFFLFSVCLIGGVTFTRTWFVFLLFLVTDLNF